MYKHSCVIHVVFMIKTNINFMKEKLFQLAFKKAEQQSGKTSKNGVSAHLENVFTLQLNFQTSKVTFSRYYEQFIEESTDKIMNPSTELLNNLSKYVGYDSYEDFVTRLNKKNIEKDKGFLQFLIENKWVIIFILLVLVIVVFVMQFNRQRWMVWKETHYEEVSFDLEKYNVDQLKLYKEERIKNFKKVTPDCETIFFNTDGKPNLWYGKNHKKELQYFTSLGLHPETGNSLKPITRHMIKKYICEDY